MASQVLTKFFLSFRWLQMAAVASILSACGAGMESVGENDLSSLEDSINFTSESTNESISVFLEGNLIKYVDFYLDNETQARFRDTASPFSYTQKFEGLSEGAHKIKAVIAIDVMNEISLITRYASFDVSKREPASEPQNFTQMVEAEAFTLQSLFAKGTLTGASGGQAISVPTSVANTTTPAANATYNFSVATAGNYNLYTRVYAPSASSDAFYMGFNGIFKRSFPQEVGKYQWVSLSQALQAGNNQVVLGHGEAGIHIDLLVISNTTVDLVELEKSLPKETPAPPPPPPPPPPPSPATPVPAGTWNLMGNPNYNTSARTWKSGGRITGEALEALIGLEWWRNNPSQHMDGNTNSRAASDNTYTLGRTVRDRMQAMLIAFRLTGDLRFLDTVVSWLEISKANLKVGYINHDKNAVTWPASPYRCWRAYVGTAAIDGTDLSGMNEIKWHAAVAEITWALYLNREHTSPGGHDYRNLHTYWRNYLVNEFVPKWSGGGIEGWRQEYRGVRKGSTYGSRSPGTGPQRYGRAPAGEWPILVNGGDLHSTVSSALLSYYMGMITGNQSALNESQWVVDRFRTQDSVLIGSARVWGHAAPSHGATSKVAQGSTYVPYTLMDHTTLYLEGQHGVTDAFMRQLAQAQQNYLMISGVTSNNGSELLTNGHITGNGTSIGGFTANTYSGRSQLQVALNPHLITSRWNSFIESEAKRLLTGKSWAGTLDKPKSPMPNASLLLKHAPL